MTKWILLPFLSGLAFAQNSKNPFDKPPANVDDALRARMAEFYQLHVTGKFRQAELLVAPAARDAFYASAKPDIKDFKITDVVYSDSYKKAKATIVSKMQVGVMGTVQVMTVPFPSNWEIEKGKWCFYYPENRSTPFGPISSKTVEMGKAAEANPFKPVELGDVANAVKADRNIIRLGSPEDKITISNALPGSVTLSLSEPRFAGLDVKLDRTELKAGEKAILTVTPKPAGPKTRLTIGVIVMPTNQVIQIEVK